jgi:lambda repressor-like predicted transcriptional regulator
MEVIKMGKIQSPRNAYWAHGEIIYLAKESGVSYRTLISILHRVRRASYQVAKKLERATKTMGRLIEADIWVNGFCTDHPAFKHAPDEPAGSVNIDTAESAGRSSRNPYWACGEITALSKEAGVSLRILTGILKRRARASYPIATRLEAATEKMRRSICRDDWLDNLGSKHPAFSGEPVTQSRRPEHCFVNIDKKSETNSEGSV